RRDRATGGTVAAPGETAGRPESARSTWRGSMSVREQRRRRGVDDDVAGESRFFESGAGDTRAVRKTLQLCKEVSRTLSCALGAAGDARLRDMVVAAVDPAPDASRLMVTVCCPGATALDVP